MPPILHWGIYTPIFGAYIAILVFSALLSRKSYPVRSAFNRTNMDYEYDDANINNLLLLRAKEKGLDLARTVLMPPIDNMVNKIVEQLHSSSIWILITSGGIIVKL